MAKKQSQSIIEASLLEKSEADLKEYALDLFENQRRLREERKTDPKITEMQEYVRGQYSEPNSDTEKKIKLVRRVFKLRNIAFKEPQ